MQWDRLRFHRPAMRPMPNGYGRGNRSWFGSFFNCEVRVRTSSDSSPSLCAILAVDMSGKLSGELWEDRYVRTCGYGSIPIITIFSGMNIHLPAILMFTRGTRFWHTAIYIYIYVYSFELLRQISPLEFHLRNAAKPTRAVHCFVREIVSFFIRSCQKVCQKRCQQSHNKSYGSMLFEYGCRAGDHSTFLWNILSGSST